MVPRFHEKMLFNVPIMSNKFHIMSLMALLNTVYTYGVAVCGVTSVTPRIKQKLI